MTKLRPLSAVKLTWTACDVVGHVANCQVSVAYDNLVCSGNHFCVNLCLAICWCLQLGGLQGERTE